MKTIAAKDYLWLNVYMQAHCNVTDRQLNWGTHLGGGGGGHSDFFFYGDVPPPPSKGLGNGPEGQKTGWELIKGGEIGGLQNGLKNPRGSSLIANWTI